MAAPPLTPPPAPSGPPPGPVPSWRRRLELRLGPALVLLARLPRVVPFLLVLALLVGGLLLGGPVGGALLLVLTALLALLLLLAWPALPAQGRLLRSAVTVLLGVRALAAFF